MQQYTLSDSHDRQFSYLRLSITDACNFRCNYCLPNGYCPSSAEPYLSLEEIEALVKAFALNGIRKIRLTGGEPTLRKDLREIIQICKSVEGIETVALTSNGYRIHKQLPQLVQAGLDHLNLSIDSLNPETFHLITGHNKLDEVLTAIEMAVQLGVKKVKVNSVLMREYNAKELQQFFRFVQNKPVSLRFIELMQTGDNQAFFEQQHVSGQHIQQQLEDDGWLQVLREPNAGPAIEYTHPKFEGNIGLIMPYSKNFCASCNRLRVSSHGKLFLCLFGEDHHNLRPYITEEGSEALGARIRTILQGKNAAHDLHQGNSGSTHHLAMIGG